MALTNNSLRSSLLHDHKLNDKEAMELRVNLLKKTVKELSALAKSNSVKLA